MGDRYRQDKMIGGWGRYANGARDPRRSSSQGSALAEGVGEFQTGGKAPLPLSEHRRGQAHQPESVVNCSLLSMATPLLKASPRPTVLSVWAYTGTVRGESR